MFVSDQLDAFDSKLTKPVTLTQVSKSATVSGRVCCADLKHLAVFEQYLGHDMATRWALLYGSNWHGNHLVMVDAVDKITDAQVSNFARPLGSSDSGVWLRAPTEHAAPRASAIRRSQASGTAGYGALHFTADLANGAPDLSTTNGIGWP